MLSRASDGVGLCAVDMGALLAGIGVVVAVVSLALGGRWCALAFALALRFGRGDIDRGRRTAGS